MNKHIEDNSSLCVEPGGQHLDHGEHPNAGRGGGVPHQVQIRNIYIFLVEHG